MGIKDFIGTNVGRNNMSEQPRQNWVYWKGSLDVSPILNEAKDCVTSTATTFGGEQNSHRISKVGWLSENPLLTGLLLPYVQEAAQIFTVNVLATSEIQYTEYHATEGGKYDWHHDVDWNNNKTELDRKLSVTVQLSDPLDYDGGVFEFQETEQPNIEYKTKGTVLIFPSYLQHRVTPVTRGLRKSLVAWFYGPRWS
tara:strand:- start:103 stop:693 length:591 start_codon:yes stop_codon:yes gene_type:complete